MPRLALALYALFLVAAFGIRSAVHYRQTGSLGVRLPPPGASSAARAGSALFVLALVLAFVAPTLTLAGWLDPIPRLEGTAVRGLGLALYVVGLVLTLWAQLAMGTSWRIGVDPRERTALVTRGPFRLVRNPIFSAMMVAAAGLALLVPNALAVAAVVGLVAAIELQVRRVEEPYLLTAHGPAYAAYAGSTGRFVPGVGRLDTLRPG
jgi:protein-S-isoprenylcysteine O-methyltransferase Ste14